LALTENVDTFQKTHIRLGQHFWSVIVTGSVLVLQSVKVFWARHALSNQTQHWKH